MNDSQSLYLKQCARRPRWRAFRESPRAPKGVVGSSLVEFALVIPMLLTLVMGILVFGIALNQYLSLTNATTMGAQAIATGRGQVADPCATAVAAIEGAAPLLRTASITFYFSFNGSALTQESSCTTQTLVQGQNVQVKATYPCKLSVYNVNFAPSCTLTAQTAEAIE